MTEARRLFGAIIRLIDANGQVKGITTCAALVRDYAAHCHPEEREGLEALATRMDNLVLPLTAITDGVRAVASDMSQ